jgi:tetraacyldisaccharide-1-P 4'-kinase
MEYGTPYSLFSKETELVKGSGVIGFAGLADNSTFRQHITSKYNLVHFESFADHHTFSLKEIQELWSKYGNFAQALVTTEKDAVRLRNMTDLEGIPIYVIPISIAFLNNESDFIQLLRST